MTLPPLPDHVAHLHSNGAFCQDHAVTPQKELVVWPVDLFTADQMRSYAEQAVAERMKEAGWICKDGFPALIGSRPLKPGAKLYARPDDWSV